jgi:hypothetical protein
MCCFFTCCFVFQAIEQVEKAAKLQLLKKFKVMNSKYKGAQGQEK